MPTVERTSYKYYTISKEDHPDGLIRHKDRNKKVHHFGGLEGILTSIELKKDEYEGEEQMKWHFKFEDADHNQVEVLQMSETASAARGLLMTLMSCDEPIGWVKVVPYRKEHDGKTYTNLWTEVNGHDVEWKDEVADNLPEVKEVEYKGQKLLDDEERRKYVRGLAARIKKEKLAGRVVHGNGQAPTANSGPTKKEAPDGMQQASDTYSEPDQSEQPKSVSNNLDMENWEEDDDLPF